MNEYRKALKIAVCICAALVIVSRGEWQRRFLFMELGMIISEALLLFGV